MKKRKIPERCSVAVGSAPSWRDHEMMSVVGCIDAHGAITARACKEIGCHRPEESRGKRWRFLVWSQDFHALAPRTIEEDNNRRTMLILTEEEHFAVCDWLIRHGYADDRILPNTAGLTAAPNHPKSKP